MDPWFLNHSIIGIGVLIRWTYLLASALYTGQRCLAHCRLQESFTQTHTLTHMHMSSSLLPSNNHCMYLFLLATAKRVVVTFSLWSRAINCFISVEGNYSVIKHVTKIYLRGTLLSFEGGGGNAFKNITLNRACLRQTKVAHLPAILTRPISN